MYTILGISCYYHDSAACLLIDGKIVAAAMEERFTRQKHDNNFPKNAIAFCLEWSGLKPEQVNRVIFYEKPVIKFERILYQHLEHFPKSGKVFINTIGSWISTKLNISGTLKKECGIICPISYIDHHLSHAASVYDLSGFDKAMIVTIDAVGEWTTTSIGKGVGNNITIDREIHFPHSLGLLYSAMTAYLGFSVNDAEYKVMGLAAYGDPKPFRKQMDDLINLHGDGSFNLNMKYFDFTWADHMFNRNLEDLFGLKRRSSESIMQRNYENIAAALQEKLEQVIINLLNAGYKKYRIDNLCLSGGVALNSVANGKILKHTKFKHLYIPPDPGDGGGALGAALFYWCQVMKKTYKADTFFPALGPSYTDDQIETIITSYGLSYEHLEKPEVITNRVAKLLSKQKIIGWYQGRMEWGPRALGCRSILASAARNEMKDIINVKVKHRELFRPFAPVILKENVNSYFYADNPLPVSAKYMLMVYPFKKKGITEVPAAVHVDNSGRLQVIERKDNPLYYDLIKQFGKITGTPVIINTSFNVRGEPIVCSPVDAVECFLKTDIDYLMIGNFLVRKSV